jgi:hypothetical protein
LSVLSTMEHNCSDFFFAVKTFCLACSDNMSYMLTVNGETKDDQN